MHVTAAQIKSARTLLGWNTHDLAKHSNLSISTINNVENERHTTHKKTINKIIQTFEKFGICFVENSGVLLNSSMKVFEGVEGFQRYSDYVFNILKNTTSEYRVYTADEVFIKQKLGAIFEKHCMRLAEHNIKMRLLSPQGDFPTYMKNQNCEIKKFSKYGLPMVAATYFAGNTAFFLLNKLRIVVLQDCSLFDLGVKNFDYIWDSIK